MTAEAPADQIVHLREAVRLDPGFAPALLALGQAYFANQDYDSGGHYCWADAEGRSECAGSGFLSRAGVVLIPANYREAEDAFAFVSDAAAAAGGGEQPGRSGEPAREGWGCAVSAGDCGGSARSGLPL